MAPSKRLRLFVSPSEGKWIVQWERPMGTKLMTNMASGYVESKHGTQPEAVAAALAVVARAPEHTCSQIVVRGQHGKFRTEWAYGKDPFPPRRRGDRV